MLTRFGFVFLVHTTLVAMAMADRLDTLLAKHWHHCGQSLHRRDEGGGGQTNRTSIEPKFEWLFPKTCSHQHEMTSRIVGGTDAERNEFPWQISLRRYSLILKRWIHTCGGAIVDSRWILTAAHCVMSSNDPAMYRVRIGEYNYSLAEGDERDLNVSKIHAHPDFNLETIEPDICLLELQNEIVLSPESNYRPICLPKSSVVVRNSSVSPGLQNNHLSKMCISTGWGKLVHRGEFPKILQKVCVDLVDQDQCRRSYQEVINVTDRMICSGQGGKGTCEGDSGGPLQCLDLVVASPDTNNRTQSRWSLYGLTSWAIGCAEEQFPSVATNVASMREWIADIIMGAALSTNSSSPISNKKWFI